ncbi:hypothetical protein RND81_10G210800 [Saponaria officinalis]|uniref:BSD domain-containing protein n=1 Tax=Saponaria officinalis TaxID=3572 RepID=A0AAW1I635_SAPOF
MEFWNKAKSLAEEAAKKSQELTIEAAKKSQELTSSIVANARISDIVSETAKRSKELAAEASNQIKSLSLLDNFADLNKMKDVQNDTVSFEELHKFGVTEELKDFVQSITFDTFKDFPLPDDSEVSDIPTVSNVQQDLTQWQARHATLMLTTVKEISKLRYELCPRIMKERKFWRIYFLIVNSHVAPYEKKYMEEAELRAAEQEKAEKSKEITKSIVVSKPDGAEPAKTTLQKATSSAEQDLDVFLLGDLGDSDEGPEEEDDGFDDDLDKIGESSEDEHPKDSKK